MDQSTEETETGSGESYQGYLDALSRKEAMGFTQRS